VHLISYGSPGLNGASLPGGVVSSAMEEGRLLALSSIGLTADKLDTVRQAPHIDALQWRWNSSDRELMSVDTVPVTTS